MPTTAKPFNESDWECFSGAEKWDHFSGGHSIFELEPILRECPLVLILADSTHVELYYGNQKRLCLPIVFPTQMGARVFVDALPEDLTPEDASNLFGFHTLEWDDERDEVVPLPGGRVM